MNLQLTKDLFLKTLQKWYSDQTPRLAAALSFYTTLSLAPVLLIILWAASMLYNENAVRGELIYQFKNLIGQDGAQALKTILRNASKPQESFWAALLGIITFIVGSTTVLSELQGQLNLIWKIRTKKGKAILQLFRSRILSFTLMISIGFLLIISLIVNAIIVFLGTLLVKISPIFEYSLSPLNFFASFIVITFLFALLFKFLPDVKLRFTDVWQGAAITSLFFSIGKQVIGIYLGQSTISSTYGAAGSLVVILIWIYYSAQIFFLGVEFTNVRITILHHPVEPQPYAEFIEEQKN